MTLATADEALLRRLAHEDRKLVKQITKHQQSRRSKEPEEQKRKPPASSINTTWITHSHA